ncbi:photosystem II reaction center protein Psb28 [cyanobacterium endosymbiont of Epithemia turgida]
MFYEVNKQLINRKPTSVKAILIINFPDKWEHFMYFIKRYI